jgi:hypothetical protein
MVGLGNVDNTSDANKPVSSATQTALNAKAALTANQTFTGDQTITGKLAISSNTADPLLSLNQSGSGRLFQVSQSGTVKFFVDNSGQFRIGASGSQPAGALHLNLDSLGANNIIGQSVRGANGQTVDLAQWQKYDGATTTVLAGINNIGQMFTGSTAPLQSSSLNAQFSVTGQPSTVAPVCIIQYGASGSGNLMEWRDSSNNIKMNFGSDFNLYGHGSMAFMLRFFLNPSAKVANLGAQVDMGASSNSGMTIQQRSPESFVLMNKAAYAQTGDLIQTQRADGTILSGKNANGQIYSGPTTIKGSTVALTAATASSTTVATYTYGGTTSLVTVGQLVTITNVTPSYFNSPAAGFAVTAIGGSSGAWTFTVAGSGFTTSGTGSAFGTFQLPAQASITASSAGTQGLVVKGAANQTINLQEWQNSTANIQASISPFGVFTSGQNVINAVTSTIVPLLVKANSSGSANLQEWQNNGGTPQLSIRADGITKHIAGNTSTSVGATGTAATLPALPVGYLQIDVGGTLYKLAYYNN